MDILFAALSASLLLMIIGQRIQYKKLQREINYISHRLETLSITSENSFVLLPTDNTCIKKLGAVINTLLQDFYSNKSAFEQSQKAMAQVLTNISHDIRTPLTVLKGNSEMLAARTKDLAMPENLHAMAAQIDKKADDLAATVNDYFTMAKIASGDFPLSLRKENIAQICHDTILDYYDFLEKRQFKVEIQIPAAAVFSNTDKDALQRILKNLIENAIRHGGSGNYLALRLISAEGKNIIEIEDHGKGLTPQQQKKIFARNYTTAPKSSGNGLGLAISKSLSEKIGAKLHVHSIQNQKTIFSVILES